MHLYRKPYSLVLFALTWCSINKSIWIFNKKSSILFPFWWSHQTITVPQGLGTTDEDGLPEFSFCTSGTIEYLEVPCTLWVWSLVENWSYASLIHRWRGLLAFILVKSQIWACIPQISTIGLARILCLMNLTSFPFEEMVSSRSHRQCILKKSFAQSNS